MKYRNLILIITPILLAIVGCSSFGTKIEFGKSDVFYTATSNEADAKRLGEYLQAIGLLKDPVTVQLNKADKTQQVRICVGEELAKDESMVDNLAKLGARVSGNVFNGEPVEVHMCDKSLKTLKSIPAMPLGKCVGKVGEKETQVYYLAPVTEDEAKLVLDALNNDKWGAEVAVSKEGDTYKVMFAFTKETMNTDGATQMANKEALTLSVKAFKGQKVVPVLASPVFKKVKELAAVQPQAAEPPPQSQDAPAGEPGGSEE